MKGSLIIAGLLAISAPAAWSDSDPAHWDLDPGNQDSLTLAPVRENAQSHAKREDAFGSEDAQSNLTLALKHFARPGAQPVLLIHGLAQNDRCWDAAVAKYSFARFLHAQGFDVWVGNERSAGTPGFRSDTPEGPHHWTVEDYAVYDIPALINTVRERTGMAPFVIGHSLAAWSLEGYLAGLTYDSQGRARPSARLARDHEQAIRGVITIAGVYNMWWQKSVDEAAIDPILSAVDYYHSNYELQLLARTRPIFYVVPELPALPLGWIGSILNLPLDKIPFIGGKLRSLYEGFQDSVIGTPVLSMFFYPGDSDPESVRLHAVDGLEDLGPRLLEQLANGANQRELTSYYHLDRPDDAYVYASRRESPTMPMLFVGGGRDRLANSEMIYEDGYLDSPAVDKQFIRAEEFGHLDILTGRNAAREVMAPVVKWMRERM